MYDANLEFYHWLFSNDARQILLETLDTHPPSPALEGYRAIIDCTDDFYSDLNFAFHHTNTASTVSDEPGRTYQGVSSLQTYLSTVSKICQDFELTPYSFKINDDMLRAESIEAFVISPPKLIDTYIKWYCSNFLLDSSRVVGFSCIGQEQLLFTLAFARLCSLRGQRVVVGGTIFSRIVQRGLLPLNWLNENIRVIVHNEGERPLTALLALEQWTDEALSTVDGISFCSGGRLITTKPSPALKPAELPIPDFDGLPLSSYFTSAVTLPILASRGCYWGHCEFCHHGMVYGEKYSSYNVSNVISTVRYLAKKYQVSHFSFNDEAVPPKLLRLLGQSDLQADGLSFQALIKFEKYFTDQDFSNLYKVGFRSLYVGLESANERVLASMRKNTKRSVIFANLTAARNAGIWVHCFLFFGFPGETEGEAQDTVDFILSNSDIIGSFGAGNFEFEYGAPISRHVEDFPLVLSPVNRERVDVYATYRTTTGLSQERAADIAQKLHQDARKIAKYDAVKWIPRELFLLLLAQLGSNELIARASIISHARDAPLDRPLRSFVSVSDRGAESIFINRLNRRTLSARSTAKVALQQAYSQGWSLGQIAAINPVLTREFGVE